jgi:hypothetical protein
MERIGKDDVLARAAIPARELEDAPFFKQYP